MGAFDIFTTDAQNAARDSQVKGLTTGYTGANNLIAAGSDQLRTSYADALKPLQTTFDAAATGTGQQGYQAYADASGANGPEGLARAKALFTATPGYTEGLNLTLDQNDRRAASRGTLGSGGTMADTAKIATTYADQGYGNYASRLAPFTAVPGQMTAAAGGIAGVNTGLGTGLNANTTNLADLFNKANIGAGNANANADLASLTASGNIVGAGMNLAKLLIGSGGMPSFGSFFGGGGGGSLGGSAAGMAGVA